MGASGGYTLYLVADIAEAMPRIIQELAVLADHIRSKEALTYSEKTILEAIPTIVDVRTLCAFVEYPEYSFHEKGPVFAENVLRLSYGHNVSDYVDTLSDVLRRADVRELFSEETWT